MKCFIKILFHSFLAIIFLSPYSQVEALVIDVFDQGTYNSGFGYDSHFPNETEAGTGQTTYIRPDNPDRVYSHFHNAFFIFDLTSINDQIYSATLSIELQSYYSRDPFESFTVYDVATPIDSLRAGGRHLWDPIGIDLESGTAYGSATIQQTDIASVISIQLSDAAIFDINSSFGGYFAVGIHSTTSNNPQPGLYDIDYFDFGEQGAGVQQLVLENTVASVPEPATILLLGTGLVGLLGFGRKKLFKK